MVTMTAGEPVGMGIGKVQAGESSLHRGNVRSRPGAVMSKRLLTPRSRIGSTVARA